MLAAILSPLTRTRLDDEAIRRDLAAWGRDVGLNLAWLPGVPVFTDPSYELLRYRPRLGPWGGLVELPGEAAASPLAFAGALVHEHWHALADDGHPLLERVVRESRVSREAADEAIGNYLQVAVEQARGLAVASPQLRSGKVAALLLEPARTVDLTEPAYGLGVVTLSEGAAREALALVGLEVHA